MRGESDASKRALSPPSADCSGPPGDVAPCEREGGEQPKPVAPLFADLAQPIAAEPGLSDAGVGGYDSGVRGASVPLLTLVLLGCARSVAPSRSPTPSSTPEDVATIVFVRPASACASNLARIVDEGGRFVGVLAPGTSFAIPVQPMWYAGTAPSGAIFYVWPSLEWHPKPGFIDSGPVDFIRVIPRVHGPTYVGVVQLSPRCEELADLRFIFAHRPSDETVEWSRSARPSNLDAREGQSLLDRDADATRRYFDLARALRERAESAQRDFNRLRVDGPLF